jgi:hypothetical protein
MIKEFPAVGGYVQVRGDRKLEQNLWRAVGLWIDLVIEHKASITRPVRCALDLIRLDQQSILARAVRRTLVQVEVAGTI